MLNGTGRGLVLLSSHLTNCQLIPSWGTYAIQKGVHVRVQRALEDKGKTVSPGHVAIPVAVAHVDGLQVFFLRGQDAEVHACRQGIQTIQAAVRVVVPLPEGCSSNSRYPRPSEEYLYGKLFMSV